MNTYKHTSEGTMTQVITRLKTWLAHELTPKSAIANTAYFSFALLFSLIGFTLDIMPFGVALVGCAWLQRQSKYALSATAGAIIGALITADTCSLISVAAMFLFFVLAVVIKQGVTPIDKAIILCIAIFVPIPFVKSASTAGFVSGFFSSMVSMALAYVLSWGHDGIKHVWKREALSYSELTGHLCALTLFSASFGSFTVLGIRIGCMLAAVFTLCVAAQNGFVAAIPAIALGLGRVMAGDPMTFVGALAICATAAGPLHKFGRLASSGAFAITSVLLSVLVSLTGMLNIAETVAAVGIFLLLPTGFLNHFTISQMGRGELGAIERVEIINKRLCMTANAIDEVAQIFDSQSDGPCGCDDRVFMQRQLFGMSSMLRRLTHYQAPGRLKYSLDVGAMGKAKEGSRQSGDSMGVCRLDDAILVALSDGMGSGAQAHRESSSAIALLTQLLEAGFEPDEALECLNRLLIHQNGDTDFYSTMDCLLFDRTDGSAKFIKFGAPESYLVRDGKLHKLYAEALPAGIVANASPAMHIVTLRRGDTVVMMTDGVSDTLGAHTGEAILSNVCTANTVQDAASALLSKASEAGANDDISVIVIRVQ